MVAVLAKRGKDGRTKLSELASRNVPMLPSSARSGICGRGACAIECAHAQTARVTLPRQLLQPQATLLPIRVSLPWLCRAR